MNTPSWSEIAGLIATIPAMGAFVLSAMSYVKSAKNGKKIEEVHISINSRMDQLLSARGDASMAAGVEQGRNESRVPVPEEPPVKVAIVSVPAGVNKDKPNA